MDFRKLPFICTIISFVTTALCFQLAWDYMFTAASGMHPASAGALSIITWLLTWACWRFAYDPIIDNLHQLEWPQLPKS